MQRASTAVQVDHGEESELKSLLALHEAALASMSHGLCMVDASQHVLLWNKRFIEMFDLAPSSMRVGVPMGDLIAQSADRGNFPASQIEEVKRRRLDLMSRGEPFRLVRQMSRGRTFAMDYRPLRGGGWITLVEDVTERQRQEFSMRVQFERFDQAINHMSHGLCAVDADHRIVLFNSLFLQMYGLSNDVIRVGAWMRDVIDEVARRGYFPNATPEQVWQRRLEKMASGKPFQQRQTLRNGRDYILHYHPMADGGWVTLCEDVTERHHMEQELRLQYERFDQAVNHMSHGLCMFGQDERLIVCNARYLEMYGLDPAVVRAGVSHGDVLRHWLSAGNDPGVTVDEFVAARKTAVMNGEIATRRLKLRDGRMIETISRATPDGGWVSAHEDVTERVRSEEALREQNILFDAALDNMAHGLCVFDQDWRVVVRNRRYLDMYNLRPEDTLPGTPLVDVVRMSMSRGTHGYEGGPEKFVADFTYRLANSKDAEVERRVVVRGRTLSVRHQRMTNGGWVGTFEDITERERAAEELSEQYRRFDAALENMAHGLCMFDKDWRVIVHNQRFLELYRLTPDAVPAGTPLVDLIRVSQQNRIHANVDESPDELLESFKRSVMADGGPVVRRFSDGRLIAIRYQALENGHQVCTYEDITERERAADLLKEQHHRFDVALNNMAHGLCMFDEDMRLIVSNRRYAEMFNLSPRVVRPGMSVRDVMERSIAVGNYRHTNITLDGMYEAYVTSLNGGDLITQRHLADGRILKITHEPMQQGGWVAIYEDITERHRAEESIAHMARHDALTQLPNRVLLREKMAEGLARVEQGEAMAVFYLDLDNFKGVNDTLGHPIGDKLLGIIAERVRGAVGEHDTIARLGGDEFAVLQCGSSVEAAGDLARRLVEMISEPIDIDGQEINSGVSIGIAIAPNDGTAADHLMKCADLALYRAKAEGRATFRFFEPDMDARIQARRALEVDLRRAMQAGEFSLAYQPQIGLAANDLTGMEALLRWTHAERGTVPPSEFIPLAEEMGLIVPLGEWVLREACKEAARWPDTIKVAVNLSPVQFRNRGLVTTVTQALAAARLSPHRLELEITEAVLLQNDEMTVAMLHQLRALGVRISMDDFGTGYSSLSYLRSFPFDKIKIDRSFIKDIDRNRDSAAIIKAIASLGASLGIETTAEGVETEEQLDIVRRAGCTAMQGYLVSKPRPPAELGDLIARFRQESVAA